MTPAKTVACLLLMGLTSVSCATPRGGPGALPDIEPGARPALESDEAGLWMAVDHVEERLKTSGRIVTDPGLNTYVRDIVCKLAGPYCGDIRVYVVQTPHFNASMAPNGAMEVWTGLILRAQNEAQLAYVLGHEIAHYLRRHSVQMWRDARLKTDALIFFQLLASAAGYGYVSDLGQLITLGSIFAFSRDNEREADSDGFELMVEAGYDPREAPKIWQALVEEREAAEDRETFIFFATHPTTGERIATLESLADEYVADREPGVKGEERFLAATLPFRATFVHDELRQREFARSQVVLDHLFEAGVNLGELHFFQGELYRLRDDEGDGENAVEAYLEALETGHAPPETHRSLGLLFSRAGAVEKARSSFERYLRSRPDAEDRKMIKAYLNELE